MSDREKRAPSLTFSHQPSVDYDVQRRNTLFLRISFIALFCYGNYIALIVKYYGHFATGWGINLTEYDSLETEGTCDLMTSLSCYTT